MQLFSKKHVLGWDICQFMGSIQYAAIVLPDVETLSDTKC